MWNTQIRVGSRDVVDSGFITSYGDDLVEIGIQNANALSMASANNLTFIFEFRDNGSEPNMEMVEISDVKLKLVLYNHRSGGVRMGGTTPRIGPTEPLEVGELNDRKLFLNYQVSSRGGQDEGDKATDLYYTLYLGEVVDENNTSNTE